LGGKLKYGQDYYDFDEGGLLFAAPNQIIGNHGNNDARYVLNITLLIHPDFFLELSFGQKNKAIWLLFLFGK
jgi:AraC family transcriptional activator of pobA